MDLHSSDTPMKLGKAEFSCPLADANLTTRFGVYSFVCIGVMTAALWFIVSKDLTKDMLDREWETTAKIVRAEVKWHMTPEDFKAQDLSAVAPRFEDLLRQLIIMPDIVRIKAYNRQGTIIWSDEKRLVGTSFPNNPELKKAFGGSVVVDLSPIDKGENVYERGSFQGLVELYVPIFSGDKKEVIGVIETYKAVDDFFNDIKRARAKVLIVALGGGLLLYLALFAIVRQASRKISEQQANILKMQSELVASQRMAAVGETTAAVAHGIGNPLSSIRATAQLSMLDCGNQNGRDLAEKMQSNLQNIIHQVDRVQGRMRELLNFAKPLEPHPSLVDLNSLLREQIETLRSRFGDAGVSCHLRLDERIPKARVDPNHLEQALSGLLSNALEATPRGGSVTVSTGVSAPSGQARRVNISIEDSGEGIPKENRERVFEPFFTTKPHGTGVGLSLTKKFIERNGGMLSISDGSNGGTRVEVAIPLA